MSQVFLTGMTPAQEQGWEVLLDLAVDFAAGWCLVGGQMVWLHARERGVDPPRTTEDVDVVVDVRTDPKAIRRLCVWLEGHGFDLAGINAEGVGHRYVRALADGPGRVVFDVLAPDNVGPRADLVTDPIAASASLSSADRRRLRTVDALLDERHVAWRPLGDRARLGQTALEFLLEG